MDEEKGYLQFQIINIRKAIKILRKTHSDLLERMRIDSVLDPNDYGHLDRIIREYIVNNLAALFDDDGRTFSLKNLNSPPVNAILLNSKYQQMLKEILKNRHNAFSHHNRNFIMTETIISTNDLFGLPIEEFLSELEAILK